ETGSCSGCDLAGADLYEADLFQADLSLSDLSGADLTAADLTLANLRSVDLRGAILDETNLSGANLAKVLLDKDVLAGAIFDSERTRTTLGFKDLKLGMNAVEVAQYCSLNTRHLSSVIHGTPRYSALNPDKPTYSITAKQLGGTCFDNADMPFIFKFSGGGTTGVLNFLQVGLAPYTKKGQRKFIDLLAKKYKPAYSYSAQDVETFNNNRDWDIKRLHTIFANGQVTLSIVGEGAGLQMLLTYRDIEHGRRFLKLKGGPAPVDLTHLPPITTDLYKLVGNYKLKGIGAKGTSTNHGRIDTAYLEIDAFENELAGELVISGRGMSERFRIIGIEKISGNRLTVQLEPVTGTIPDGEPLRMSLEFSEDGDSFTGKWTNWFNKSRRPDDFKGSRSQSFWQTAMSHNRIDMYQAYLRLRPGGIYSAVARSRITALGGTLPAPSAPTVSVAASTSPSTLTTTATTATPIDPLVGVWNFAPMDGVGWGYFIVGMDDQGGLTGFSWQGAHADRAYREITIESLSDGSYNWHSDQSVSLVNPSFATGDAADGGKFWVKEHENYLPTVTSSKKLFLQWRGLPPRQTLQKIALEDALTLELPPEVPQDFPSPFATEGKQVASVPKASASASAVPSTSVTPTATTTTATAVDPLVGIWVRTGSDIAWTNECWLLVGQTEDGILIGKAQDSTR
ncbi:pentapeptide repeat-containing protein, partial [Gammaproteobacteria bacterium]|nr:pentapeptide repeat-containing protein [Gammaproteobacteria bacterium]